MASYVCVCVWGVVGGDGAVGDDVVHGVNVMGGRLGDGVSHMVHVPISNCTYKNSKDWVENAVCYVL